MKRVLMGLLAVTVGLLVACAGSVPAKPHTPEAICAADRPGDRQNGYGNAFFVGTTITGNQNAALNAAGYTGQCLDPDAKGLGLTGYAVLIDATGACISIADTNEAGCVGTYSEAQNVLNTLGKDEHLTIVTAKRDP